MNLQYADDPSSCTATCGKVLGCGHACAFACGQCFLMASSTEDTLATGLDVLSLADTDNTASQGQHPPCAKLCGKMLACGHVCSKKCHSSIEPCALCFRQCPISCEHSKCSARCLEVRPLSKTLGLDLNLPEACLSLRKSVHSLVRSTAHCHQVIWLCKHFPPKWHPLVHP